MISIATLIVVSAPFGFVAALSAVVIILGHLGFAGLVPRRFKLLFRVLVTRLATLGLPVSGPGHDVKSFHT